MDVFPNSPAWQTCFSALWTPLLLPDGLPGAPFSTFILPLQHSPFSLLLRLPQGPGFPSCPGDCWLGTWLSWHQVSLSGMQLLLLFHPPLTYFQRFNVYFLLQTPLALHKWWTVECFKQGEILNLILTQGGPLGFKIVRLHASINDWLSLNIAILNDLPKFNPF